MCIEIEGQRLWPEVAQQFMLFGVQCPKQRSESTRVPESQRFTVVETYVDVIMFCSRLERVNYAYAARHAEMQYRTSLVGIK